MREQLFTQIGEEKREMTEQELLQYQADLEFWAGQKVLEQQKTNEILEKRQALLEKLGITEEEAKLLLS